ncbi:hypothetical protein EXS57_03875 [Candidatus Kaiserbacteria bacterium]|nr:hypothetical protein [Candidatus Kaiserbacteria bacterium]
MKGLFLGVLAIIIVGIGGLVYRNAVERPLQPISCPVDALVCPDGTSVGRTGSTCTFAVCVPPNVALPAIAIAFALPDGFTETTISGEESVATYEMTSSTTDALSRIVIRRYSINASSTALAAIQQTAIGAASGEPVSATSFSSRVLGTHRFTIVTIDRFEGVVDTAYYLARGTDVIRFDAIDTGVMNWTDANLNVATLPAHAALLKLLSTLQGKG